MNYRLSSRREVDEICAALSYHAENSGDFLPTFRDKYWSQLQGSIIQDLQESIIKEVFLTLEDGTDRLSRNVRKVLLLFAE